VKHIKKALSYSIAGSLGLTVVASLSGCEQPQPPQFNGDQQQRNQNWFMVIEQTGDNPATYKVVEQHATEGPTRAILRDANGIERFLSEEELKTIAEEEARRVEAGTSRLSQDNAQMSPMGMSLGETLLAAAAGSLIGGMLANSLINNRNFQQNQARYNSTRTSAPTSLRSGSATKPRSGFFGSRSSRSGYGSFGSFGG
jgi:hypothetical protein